MNSRMLILEIISVVVVFKKNKYVYVKLAPVIIIDRLYESSLPTKIGISPIGMIDD